MGMAHPLPAQHPVAWRRLVRTCARAGDPDIRRNQAPRRNLKNPFVEAILISPNAAIEPLDVHAAAVRLGHVLNHLPPSSIRSSWHMKTSIGCLCG